MYSKQKNRKAKAGLLLIASPRFKNLGEGLVRIISRNIRWILIVKNWLYMV